MTRQTQKQCERFFTERAIFSLGTEWAIREECEPPDNRVGRVTRNPQNIIAAEIEKKSKKLPQYKAAAGKDIRLLLVTNRIHNSGKTAPQTDDTFDFHGFKAVYLFPYPENAIALRQAH